MLENRAVKPDLDHEIMRCVINDAGEVIFASPALCWALGLSATHIIEKPADKILNFIGEKNNFENISSGMYEVVLNRNDRDPLVVQARADKVKTPKGEEYLVLWLDNDEKSLRKEHREFSRAATQLADIASRFGSHTLNNAVSSPELISEIKKEDGELRHFLNLSNDLLGVYSRNGDFIRVNYAFNRTLGYSDEELRHVPFIELIHPEDREQVSVYIHKIMMASPDVETRVDFESRGYCKDGSYRWLEWIMKSIGNHIYIVGKNVTDIKQHEQELKWREKQLIDAQKIGKMGHWHWEVCEDEMQWSEQTYDIFGVAKGRFNPCIKNISRCLFKSDANAFRQELDRAITERSDFSIEFQLNHPDAAPRFLRCQGQCQKDDKTQEVIAIFGIFQDITERVLRERDLRSAKEAAETAYASKTRFLANMSHELRTPLNAIIGFSEMMQRQLLGPIGSERYLDYIGGIRESGEHLLDLINDILDMSKIEVGKYEIETEDLNIGKVLQLAVHMMEVRAHESQVRLISDTIPENVHMTADRRAIMQILLNLLSNAFKFTRAEGEVELKCLALDKSVEISVRDTGIGIPEDKIDTITLPFEQVDCELTRDHEGSGLGLAITKDLIELHGGTLKIESKVEEGTKVTVSLPYDCTQGEAVAQETENEAEFIIQQPSIPSAPIRRQS